MSSFPIEVTVMGEEVGGGLAFPGVAIQGEQPSVAGSTLHLIPPPKSRSVGIAMADLAYNRHEHKTLTVKDLHYEVEEKGLEWWQALSSFQLPWQGGLPAGCCKGQEGSEGGTARPKHKVLKGVSFEVQSGEMLAVLGSSGSGKTSLLDVIACNYESGDVTGDVFINGKRRTSTMIKECAACVRQDDRLLPHLTVKETLTFVAQLKLPKAWGQQDISSRVDNVIAELGLRHVSGSKVGGEEIRGISGGERRRVSIGIQLLLDPSILFLDEPTSGLDSFTAHHLMETLAKLAKNDRIVMLSIHQPRSDIFGLFDLIMLLSQGDMVYYGKARDMVDYFTSLGHPCPQLTNPCDFYVDLTTVDMKTAEREFETSKRVKQLVATFNEKNAEELVDCLDETDNVASKITSSTLKFIEDHSEVNGGINNPGVSLSDEGSVTDKDNGKDGMVLAEVKAETAKCASDCEQKPTDSSQIQEDAGTADGAVVYGQRRRRAPRTTSILDLEKPGLFEQFGVLLRRSMKNNLEDYGFLSVQAIEALAMSLMIGLVYYNLQLDQLSARDRFGLLYIIGALYPYMVILDVIGKYYKERFTIYFEMKDGLYTAGPYFWAKIISELPEHGVFIILYSVPVYFLAGMQAYPGYFFQCFAVIFLMVYCSRCVGQFSGALMPTYQMACLLAQTIFTFFLLSSGFIFNLENLFVGIKWTSYISYLKWGYQALCVTEFNGLNFTCPVGMPEVCLNDGEEALRAYSLDGNPVWHSVCIMITEIIVFSALFFVAMKFVSQKPHQT